MKAPWGLYTNYELLFVVGAAGKAQHPLHLPAELPQTSARICKCCKFEVFERSITVLMLS